MRSSHIVGRLSFVALSLFLLGCSRPTTTTTPTTEPVYGGKPLSQWAELTQDEDISGGPSPQARQAIQAVKAIGPAQAIPFLLKWIQPPWKNSILPGGAVQCFRIFGPDANAAIPDLAKILASPAKTMDDDSAQTMASEALSFLGSNAVPVLLTVATNFQGQQLQWEIIGHMANFGTNGAAAKPAILNWSKDPNGWVRLGALHAYVGIEDDQSARQAFLRAALKDSDQLVRRDASEYLKYVTK